MRNSNIPPEQLLALALKQHQAGELAQAEALYRQILQLDPGHPDALHLLGVLAYQVGRVDMAVELIGQAIRRIPHAAHFYNNLGNALKLQGKTAEAIDSYREATRLNPRFPDAHANLGNILKDMGKLDEAVACYETALRLQPMPEMHFNLGVVLERLGKTGPAIKHYQGALRLRPDFVEAHANLGNVLKDEGKTEEAIACYRTALRLRPDTAVVQYNLANALQEQGRLAEAIELYQAAVALDPANADVHFNLANTLRDVGAIEDAEGVYRAALLVRPDFPEAQNNLGNMLKDQGKWAEALQCYQRSIALNPTFAEAHFNLGNALSERHDIDGAIKCYLTTLSLDPEFVDAYKSLGEAYKEQGDLAKAAIYLEEALRKTADDGARINLATMLPPVYEAGDDLRQRRRKLEVNVAGLLEKGVVIDDPLKEVNFVNFLLAYQGLDDREIQEKLCRLYRGAYAPPVVALGGGAGQGRLKVGFISSFFRNHTIGKLNRGLIANLSRERFEVRVFSLGSHDDELAGRIRQDADRFIQLPSRDLAAMRELIDAENLDILFYTDIGMDPATYFLAYSRLAPVQCVTWGHPDTTGIDTIDYFISSELLETEQSERSYTESLVRLKSLPTYYYRPSLPSVPKSRAYFGFDEESHIYLCPQSLFKFHPDFDVALRGILRQDPAGRVVIIEGKFRNWTELLKGRFQKTLPDVADRIVFLPSQNQLDFFSLIAVADVMLDPFHFGGGNSTYEGLALGVPIVSLPGEFMRGRVTGACYQKMGMTDCIAANAGEYVEIALRLGTDKAYREQIKFRILVSNSVLYEDLDVVRELEQFFVRAVDVAKST